MGYIGKKLLGIFVITRRYSGPLDISRKTKECISQNYGI